MKLILASMLLLAATFAMAQEIDLIQECRARSADLGLALYNLNLTGSSATTHRADSVEIEYLNTVDRDGERLYVFKAQGILHGKKTKLYWELDMVDVPRRGCLVKNVVLKRRSRLVEIN